MEKTENFGQFLLNRLGRCAHATVGLLICALGTYIQIQANFGMSPWASLNQGLALNFPISYGTASIAVSAIIICVDLILREPIGIGTILNAIIIGMGTDVCISLNLYPLQTGLIGQIGTILLGIVLTCFGQYVYMSAGLSSGPRDSMLVGIGKRFPKIPIGRVNIVILAFVFVVCLFLGSPVGLGTVIAVFGTGIIMDIVFKIVRFNPRAVVHEGIPDTLAAMMRSLQVNK
ncbi:MAG: hypothetical protein II280_03080 [Lachnospiraceae bacterium]|nr:hypothetical protein [Lachnospiraceae bacterium]